MYLFYSILYLFTCHKNIEKGCNTLIWSIRTEYQFEALKGSKECDLANSINAFFIFCLLCQYFSKK